jgi:hypothetical protein
LALQDHGELRFESGGPMFLTRECELRESRPATRDSYD